MLYFMLWNSPVRRSVSLQFKENVVTFDFYRKTFDVRCGSTARPRNSAVSLSRSTTATAWSEVKAADLEFPRLNDVTRHASKRPKKREFMEREATSGYHLLNRLPVRSEHIPSGKYWFILLHHR